MKNNSFKKFTEFEKASQLMDQLEEEISAKVEHNDLKGAWESQLKLNAAHKDWSNALVEWMKAFNNNPNVTR